MPRALSPCGEPGCPTLTRHPYCPVHAPHGRARRSPTTRAQRDGTGDYERNRRIVLAGNPTCAYCSAPATTVDHVIAVSNGGTHELINLVPACRRCNSRKQARDEHRGI